MLETLGHDSRSGCVISLMKGLIKKSQQEMLEFIYTLRTPPPEMGLCSSMDVVRYILSSLLYIRNPFCLLRIEKGHQQRTD